MKNNSALLQIQNLKVEFPTRKGTLTALDSVSLEIYRGEVLGVVGESGAGKSMVGNAIIGLLQPPGHIADGSIYFNGQRIDNLPEKEISKFRGKHIGAVFQDPLTSLNPLFTIEDQLIETIQCHQSISRGEARKKALELLKKTGIPAPEKRLKHYPHQFSGGMRQRVVIALALCTDPDLIIADEPTTALDVSVQSQIISLLKNICCEKKTSIMLVTHDMGVISEIADRVAVMYAGQLIEIGPVSEILHHARHPYTKGLMGAIPKIKDEKATLTQISGTMPRLTEIPKGCAFHPRCPLATDYCRQERPILQKKTSMSAVACWRSEEALNSHTVFQTPKFHVRSPEELSHVGT